MQLYTLNFKKPVKKEGPRTNLSSTPLTAVIYMRSACGPWLLRGIQKWVLIAKGKLEFMVKQYDAFTYDNLFS